MSERISRRLVLTGGLLSLAACSQQQLTIHFRTTPDVRQQFFAAIRSFARSEHLHLDESRGALGTIPSYSFVLTDWRLGIVLGSGMNTPGPFNDLFVANIRSTQDPMPWAMSAPELRAFAGRMRAAFLSPGGAVADMEALQQR